jgi:imidazolonepropionase-like amidohydrolase
MTRTLVDNIGLLITNDSSIDGTLLGLIPEAAFIVDDGFVTWAGQSQEAPRSDVVNRINAHGRCVIPGFVDSTPTSFSRATEVRSFVPGCRGRVIAPAESIPL